LKGKAFRVVDEPLWREAITDFLEEELHIVVRLVVVGLVEEVRFRDVVRMEAASFGRRKKDRVRTKCMEKKVGVIDIHCDDVVIRIVEGVSDFSTFPGYEKGAQRKSFQNLCRLLHVWLEGAHVLPQRTLRVRTDSSEGMHVTAWADWERYSYCARSLFVFG
jgi:hypothetical protein